MSVRSSMQALAQPALAVGRIHVGCSFWFTSSSCSISRQLHQHAASTSRLEIGERTSRASSSKRKTSQERRPRAVQKKKQLPVLRLDPERPFIPALTPTLRPTDGEKGKQRVKQLSQLHSALQCGSADAVWAAYLSLHPPHFDSNSTAISHSGITPHEFHQVLRVVSNSATKTRVGMNRVLRLMAEVRSQQRWILAKMQHAVEGERRALRRELEEWDGVVTTEMLNSVVKHIGGSLRSIGLEEVEQVLDQLLSYEANEHTRRHISPQGSKAADPLDYLRTAMLSPSARSAMERRRLGRHHLEGGSEFPDLVTYNTILDIITRTVHRSKPSRTSSFPNPHEDDDYALSQLSDAQLEQQSAQLAAKLRRFQLDSDSAPLHLSALERAERLFNSLLTRMQRVSRIEPDAVTFNIMLTMYCLLERWDAVHEVVSKMEERGVLGVEAVNNVLWNWMRRGPSEVQDKVERAVEVYRQLRQNLVRKELDAHQCSVEYVKGSRENEEESKAEGPSENERWSDLEPQDPLANNSVREVLGLAQVPVGLVPDQVTHTLLINCLARAGRFADAFGVFKDLVSTPQPKGNKMMQPSLAIFNSFFRGFSRHSHPSRLLSFNEEDPISSTWQLVPPQERDQASLWRVDTFCEIFGAFLRFEPSLPFTRGGEGEVSTPLGWLSLREKREVDGKWRAPSTNQLFWVLTALRRVSGDDAKWSLAMWGRVVDKFERGEWQAFRMDNRLQRVVKHLQERLEEEQQKEEGEGEPDEWEQQAQAERE